MDDHVYVWDNPHIKDGLTLDGIAWAFKADLVEPSEFADYWQPVTFISRMCDISLFKMNAGAHHIVNLLFHLANVWLLYFFLLFITRSKSTSLWVTALFAVHPLHSEIIGWTTARKDVLSVFLGLITMHLFLWSKNKNTILSAFLLAFSFALSLMAKPMMITLPVLLIMLDMYQRLENKESLAIKDVWHIGLNKWPLFLMVALYLPIPFIGQPQAFEYDVNLPVVKAFVAYLFYLEKIFFPVNLSLYGPIPELKIAPALFVLSVMGMILMTLGAWLLRKRTWLVLFGWGWFLITTLPIIGLTWPADRFVYFPMIGVWIVFITLLNQFLKNKESIASIVVVFVVFFSIQSFAQISVWKNDESVMLKALEFSTQNYSAHNVLGVFYAQKDNEELALTHLKEAVRIRPSRDKPYNNIGRIYEQQGNYKEAVKYYEQSLQFNERDFRTINNLGIVYVREGDFQKGIRYFKKALEINPKALDTVNNLAITYFKAGQFLEAENIARQNNSAFLYNNFGLSLAVAKKFSEARPYFEKALAIDPNFPKARGYLNQIDAMLKQSN